MKRKRKKDNKKQLTLIFIILAIIGVFLSLKLGLSGGKFKDIELYSKNFYVYNITDDKVEFKKGESEEIPPASLTKIMTVLVALENIEDLSEIAPVDLESYRHMIERNSSMAGFYGRERTTYRDLLYGTMLASGGEAANSLAINIAGSKDEFANLMNIKTLELELEHTHFENPDGLDEDSHYSSAEDLGKILNYALQDGDFRAIFTREEYRSTSTLDHPEGILIKSTVLSRLPEFEQNGFEIIGGKSGTTVNAGQCWATLALKDEKEYICIVMGNELDSENLDGHILDTLNIMENI